MGMVRRGWLMHLAGSVEAVIEASGWGQLKQGRATCVDGVVVRVECRLSGEAAAQKGIFSAMAP